MAIRYPIFHFVPDFTDPPEMSNLAQVDVLRQTAAPTFLSFPDTRQEKLLSLRYSLTGARDLQLAKTFLSAIGGQHRVFLLPTWLRDYTVSIPPSLGGTLLQVDIEDYQTTLLPTSRDDDAGRFVFVYDKAQTEPLHVARVIRATAGIDPDTSALEIEQALPWTPSTAALWGFARIVRMADDSVTIKQYRPDRGEFEIKAITVRISANADEDLLDLDSYEIEASRAFTDASLERVDSPKLRFDYAHADGPLNLHFVQDEQYTIRWAAWIGTTAVRLGKYEEGDIWPPEDTLGAPSQLFPDGPPDTTHLSLCFDQNSWEVIAYQRTASTIAIRRRFNGVLVEHEFAGLSPALAFNGILNLQAKLDGLSDVICYYYRPGFNCIFARVQRDNFAIEYVAVQGPVRVNDLVTSDREGKKGTILAISDDQRLVTIRTDEYPDPPEVVTLYIAGDFYEQGGVGLTPLGEYFQTILFESGGDQAGVGIDMPGAYTSDIFGPDAIMELALTSLSASGNYQLMIFARSIEDREIVALRPSGLYFDAIRSSGLTTDQSGPNLNVSGNYEFVP